jgi:hypothetical protein
MPLVLVLAADHEAGDVLQEHQRNARWQHSSMKCAPFCALSLNRMPLLAMMPTGMPIDLRKAGHQRGAEARLELVETPSRPRCAR